MLQFDRIYRHGDVILFRMPETFNLSEPLAPKQELVLALGETTGHSHQLKGELLLQEKSEKTFFKVLKKAILTHEEHQTMILEKGVYLKVDQVEYDPFKGIIRRILD